MWSRGWLSEPEASWCCFVPLSFHIFFKDFHDICFSRQMSNFLSWSKTSQTSSKNACFCFVLHFRANNLTYVNFDLFKIRKCQKIKKTYEYLVFVYFILVQKCPRFGSSAATQFPQKLHYDASRSSNFIYWWFMYRS